MSTMKKLTVIVDLTSSHMSKKGVYAYYTLPHCALLLCCTLILCNTKQQPWKTWENHGRFDSFNCVYKSLLVCLLIQRSCSSYYRWAPNFAASYEPEFHRTNCEMKSSNHLQSIAPTLQKSWKFGSNFTSHKKVITTTLHQQTSVASNGTV